MKTYKTNFPIFTNHPELIYLDNASTCQKPLAMIQALTEYYTMYNSNIGRGHYKLAEQSQDIYNQSKSTIANFFETSVNNTVFTSGATDSLNQIAYIVQQLTKKSNKKTIIISLAEHHSNLLTWMRLAKENNYKIHIANIDETINPSQISQHILDDSIAFICTHVSNVTGEILPIQAWIDTAKKHNAYSIIDGSQAVSSFRVRFDKLGCDFYAFSTHKFYGPMGLGILFISSNILKEKIEPFRLGGGIVEDVESFDNNDNLSVSNYSLTNNIERFEAGTPNVANIYAFAKTIEWMESSQWYNANTYMSVVSNYMYQALKENNIKTLHFSSSLERTHIASIIIPNVHSHDLGTYLSQNNIAVRTGKHCAYPLFDFLKTNSTTRLSIALYNTPTEIEKTISKILEAIVFFKGN